MKSFLTDHQLIHYVFPATNIVIEFGWKLTVYAFNKADPVLYSWLLAPNRTSFKIDGSVFVEAARMIIVPMVETSSLGYLF